MALQRISSALITDATVATGDIADDAITAAKLDAAALAAGTFSGSVKFSGAVTLNEDTLTDGSTVSWDVTASPVAKLTLGGNRTLANPSAMTAGQSGSIFVVQDGTGSRSFNSFGSYWDFIGGTVPTFTSTASAVDRIDYIVRSSTKIHAVFTANYS